MSASRILSRFKQAGSAEFYNYVQDPDVAKAFRRVIDDARHEKGHGGYTGTIAEKHDFKVRNSTPMPRAEAARFAEKDIDNNDKWGPAFAVAVGAASKATERTIKFKVAANTSNEAYHQAREKIEAAEAKPGFTVSVDIDYYKGVKLLKEGKLPELVITKGGEEGFRVVGEMARGRVFPSRAEAVKGLKELILQNKPRMGVKYTIEKFKTTDSFTIGDPAKNMNLYEVEAKVTHLQSAGKVEGWLFYGLASS